MIARGNEVPNLTHDEAVARLRSLREEAMQVRERCRFRLEAAMTTTPSPARSDLAMEAADNYLREAIANIDELDVLKRDYPHAWDQSAFGAEERRRELQMRQVLDAALMVLGGIWPSRRR